MSSSTGFRETDQWPDLDKFHILAMLMKLRRPYYNRMNCVCARARLFANQISSTDRGCWVPLVPFVAVLSRNFDGPRFFGEVMAIE